MILFEIDPPTSYFEEPKPDPRARWRCTCGRFAKLRRRPQMNMQGEYEFLVLCATHGEVWIS